VRSSDQRAAKKNAPLEAAAPDPLASFAIILDPSRMGTAAALAPNLFEKHGVKDSIPAEWHERAAKAWEYYLEEPIVSNTINSWRVFALGDEVGVSSEDETTQDQARDMFYRLDLNSFVKDMILQLLVKGDCIGYLKRTPEGDDLAKVVCVNPVSVKLKFVGGTLTEATQRKEMADGTFDAGDGGVSLALDQMLHIKWNAPEFSPRGNSLVLPAFESIELLRDFRKAERAIAKRWTTPLRFIQVGGQFGDKVIMPSQKMIDTLRGELNKMDLKSGLVVPFYVKAETYGNEGHVLDTERKVKEVKEDILVALGMARSIVTGDGPNFATASVSMQKMVIMLKEIKQAARRILDWVFYEWMELKGLDADVDYEFSDLDLTSEVDQKRLLIDLYDRNLISKNTLQAKMDLNPEVESANRAKEQRLLDMNWDIKDVTALVQLAIMSPASARKLLGLEDAAEDQTIQQDEQQAVEAMYADAAAKARASGDTCSECLHFDEDANRCRVLERDASLFDPACRFYRHAAV